MISRIRHLFGCYLSVALLGASAQVGAGPIDLNDFFFFPGDPVVIAADGSSATIEEDPVFTPIFLSNDPGLGDPNVIIPGANVSLVFDYIFSEPAGDGNVDEFSAVLFDSAFGPIAGAVADVFVADAGSGTVAFDLSGLTGKTLGLEFALTALPGDVGLSSAVTISSVQLDERSVPAPAPGVLALLAIGALLGRIALRR